MTTLERQMAADAIALSKEHADRADAAEVRWAALKEALTSARDSHQELAEVSEDPVTHAHKTMVTAYQYALNKMRDLEA